MKDKQIGVSITSLNSKMNVVKPSKKDLKIIGYTIANGFPVSTHGVSERFSVYFQQDYLTLKEAKKLAMRISIVTATDIIISRTKNISKQQKVKSV